MKSYTVHRLVWQAFNGPIPEGYQVNHLSEKKIQNNLDNLNLMTAKENNNWGSRNIKVAKALSKPIIQCDKQGNFIKEWSSIMEIERSLGFGHQNICSCCNGKRKFANGYKWKYKIKEIA